MAHQKPFSLMGRASWVRFLAVGTLAVSLLTTPNSGFATLPSAPAVAGMKISAGGPNPKRNQVMARVQLAFGEVRLVSGAAAYRITERRDRLARGDVIITGANGRCRILINGGDTIHVGPSSMVGLDSKGGVWRANVWQGTLIAYSFPSLRGRNQERILNFAGGSLGFSSGKIGISKGAGGGTPHIMTFKNRAVWQGSGGISRPLGPRQSYTSGFGSLDGRDLERGEEKKFTLATSPEGPATEAGLKTYKNKQYRRSIRLFSHVGNAYPYNNLAPYYLGLSYLALHQLGPTIRYWRRYEKMDPAGAKEHGIAHHLTVLISKQMRQEVKAALANEKALSKAKPEPNSVAVPPFANKGSAQFKLLSKGITAMVVADLAKVPGIKVLERAKMQKLVDEIKLSQSGLTGDDTSVRAGRILKAEKLIVGDYSVK